MNTSQIHKSKYFWVANVCLWLAMHILFVHIQYKASLGTESELTWLRTWVLMSPWFFNWIWMSAAIFWVVIQNEGANRSLSQRIVNHASWMLVLLMVYFMVCTAFRIWLLGDSFFDYFSYLTRTLTSSSFIDVFIYLGVLSVAFASRFYHTINQRSIDLKRLQHALTQEQLKTLRSQLNPHFLFNALNTVASLVRLKREKEAVSALSDLSAMLRKILEHKNFVDVSIRDEIAFINSYLSIQKLRFSEKLNAQIFVQPECMDLKIPNMLLHPLVENAVEHGSQLESNHNLLKLEITCNEGQLRVVLTNSIAKRDEHEGFGIGLSNTRERLSRLYTDFKLELNPLKNGKFETLLAIPLGEHFAKRTNS